MTDPARGLTARFTGWADVSLTNHGKIQAAAAGRCLKKFNLVPDAVYTSLLRRSRDTFSEMKRSANIFANSTVINSWRLNERHYGALIGQSKDEAWQVYGHENLVGWRRSWAQAPPSMDRDDYFLWKDAPFAQPVTIYTESGKKSVMTTEKGISMPSTESLEDCAKRVKPVWINGIAPRVLNGETVLIVAHANSIRSMIKHIDSETMDDHNVRDVHIPAATPLVYSFSLDPVTLRMFKTGEAAVADTIRRLKPMGEPSRLGMTGRYVASKEVIRLALQSSVPMEEDSSKGHDTTFFDLIERGLYDILEYSKQQETSTRREAIAVSDGRGAIIHTNAEWERLCGFANDEVQGTTAKFLQGPLTEATVIKKLDEKLRTGLPARASVINYRKSGRAFENSFTIIPVYDWLRDVSPDKKDYIATRRKTFQFLDYGGFDQDQYRQYADAFMHPSHFVARLDPSPNRVDLPSLTPEEIDERDWHMKQARSQPQ